MRQTVEPAEALPLAESREQGEEEVQLVPEPEGEAYRVQLTWGASEGELEEVEELVGVEAVSISSLISISVAVAILEVITWPRNMTITEAGRRVRADRVRIFLFTFCSFLRAAVEWL